VNEMHDYRARLARSKKAVPVTISVSEAQSLRAVGSLTLWKGAAAWLCSYAKSFAGRRRLHSNCGLSAEDRPATLVAPVACVAVAFCEARPV
jgi:hypothetical protein